MSHRVEKTFKVEGVDGGTCWTCFRRSVDKKGKRVYDGGETALYRHEGGDYTILCTVCNVAKKLRNSNEHCPKCNVSFQGEKIPEKDMHAFGATHFSRVIGIYDRDRDMTVAWRCPDCKHEWSR